VTCSCSAPTHDASRTRAHGKARVGAHRTRLSNDNNEVRALAVRLVAEPDHGSASPPTHRSAVRRYRCARRRSRSTTTKAIPTVMTAIHRRMAIFE
jgi:hypothetical protein